MCSDVEMCAKWAEHLQCRWEVSCHRELRQALLHALVDTGHQSATGFLPPWARNIGLREMRTRESMRSIHLQSNISRAPGVGTALPAALHEPPKTLHVRAGSSTRLLQHLTRQLLSFRLLRHLADRK